MRIVFLLFAAAGLLAACASRDSAAAPVAAASTARTIAQGDLTGYVSAESGAQVWKGIPFAAPPVGEARWRAPGPAPAFNGPLEALASPPRCLQLTSALDRGEGLKPGQTIGSEDCLYLDIYAPGDARPGDDLPVMVWIHGGGNTWGYAGQYDGGTLAEGQDVIVVVIQYRLGPLGFFAHPALRESAEAPGDAAANFALLDMIAALEWTRDNIVAFGGDPGRVTIFGESAGGRNVAGLMAAREAAGLFHRAIIQSGLFRSITLEEAQNGGPVATGGPDVENPFLKAAARFAPSETAAAMRAAEGGAVLRAFADEDTGGLDVPQMIEDGITLPEGGVRAAIEDIKTFNAVPVITGTNRDETKLFALFDPELTRRTFGVIYTVRDADFYEADAHYQARLWRINAVDRPAQAMREGGHDDVWAYRFDWDEGGRIAVMDLSRLMGAAHSMEIPFVFNHFEFFGMIDRTLFNRDNAEGREALAAAMGGYWAEFARTGDPGRGGGAFPDWPRWQAEGVLMRFDSPGDGGPEVITGTDSFERLAADLANDPSLSPDQRCRIYERLDRIPAAGRPAFEAQLDCPAGQGRR